MRILSLALVFLCGAVVAAAEPVHLLSLNDVTGVRETFARPDQARRLEVVTGEDATADGDGALHLAATAAQGPGNQYAGILVPLPEPLDLRELRLLVDVRTSQPQHTQAFYVRAYNRGEAKACLSFNSWDGQLRTAWRTLSLQTRLCPDGLAWEPDVVETREPTAVDRLEFIIGTHDAGAEMDVVLDHLCVAPRLVSLQDLRAPRSLVPDTVLVRAGQPVATILHPDSEAGRRAAQGVNAAVRALTGTDLPARPGTPADRQPAAPVVLLGNVDSNPALLLLYARYLTPVDSVCPGPGGALVHTVHDPFGKGVNALVAGAADEAGLQRAAGLLADVLERQPPGPDLALPHVVERAYADPFLKRFAWAGAEPAPKRLEDGLAKARQALAEGRHTSIAGELATVALRYQLTGHAVEAKLFVALWDLYAESAKADPRKYGGPWGFDSDFPSSQVVAGWDSIEDDPGLSAEERLRVTRHLGRWLAEAVIPKCAGGATSARVPHNHQTFPALGALFAGLYFTQGWTLTEGQAWLTVADAIFRRQAGYTKPYEDCNGYQWLTNGHLFRYAVARPDFTVFDNGHARTITDYAIGTMNNLGYQVPYGDTGSWSCWNSEMVCLDIAAFVTGDPAAAWAASHKRQVKNTCELYAFYRPAGPDAPPPTAFDGVRTWPLDPAYAATWPAAGQPPLERCVDKIAFRESLAPEAAYLLLDGLGNGGHKHLDVNSILQLTAYDRIWLADNDYFKAPVKYHNSLLIFRDGQSAPIPPYAECVGAGQSGRFGWSRTRLTDYAGADWERTVLWVRPRQAFVVLDRVTARHTDAYQLALLWHGVGQAELGPDSLLLTQKGPGLRLDLGAGPELELNPDPELGENWKGYPHADPVVQSLRATATVRLQEGESYVFATVFHGAAAGPPAPWPVRFAAVADGVVVATDAGPLGIGLGPFRGDTDRGVFDTDAAVIALDRSGVSLLGVTRAALAGDAFHQSDTPTSLDLDDPEAVQTLARIPVREPVANLRPATEAAACPVLWETVLRPDCLLLTGNRGQPLAVEPVAKLDCQPAPPPGGNVFSAEAPNTADQLLDGNWANDTKTCAMFAPDQTVTLTVDLGQPCRLDRVRWFQWWAATSSRKTAYLLGRATVAVSADAFAGDSRAVGTVTDEGPHPNFGSPLEYTVKADGAVARWVRLTLEPKPGSAVYLAEILVEGRPQDGAVAGPSLHPTHLTPARLQPAQSATLPATVVATAEGALLTLDADGATLRQQSFPCRLNDVAAADLDGDGREELILARQDHQVTVLEADGRERWSRTLTFYRRPPYVNLVRTGDLDGDGRPEIVAGGENWRFYAFRADGTELWNYEAVHPSRSGLVDDLDGDGQAEVLCGTHYYSATALNGDGTRRWAYSLGPICYDIASGSFATAAAATGRGRGVVFGAGDGCVHVVGTDGKPLFRCETGEEVRQVDTGDLDGDGTDEIVAGSLNRSVFAFRADGQRLWRVELGAPVSGLAVVRTPQGCRTVAGATNGLLLVLDGTGKTLFANRLQAAVLEVRTLAGGTVVVATADGRIRALQVGG